MPPKRNGTKRVTRDEVMLAISEVRLLVETGNGKLQVIEERVSGIKEVMTQHQNDIGTTPATAASKRSCTSHSRATPHSSSPYWLSSCLFAVTTGQSLQLQQPSSLASSECQR